MLSAVISRFFILIFGTIYPAYASYKTVKTKNVKEYVQWMMYWIVFALFTTAETFTDVFLSWLPFYYEVKIILVIWLLSPATKGSSILYRKFVHPTLSSREQDIDQYIAKAKEQGYKHFLDLGQKSVSALMQTAIKNINLIPVFPNLIPIDNLTQQNAPVDPADRADQGDGRQIRTRSQSAEELTDIYSDDEEDLIPLEYIKPKKTSKANKVRTPKRSTRNSKKTEAMSD